MGYTLRKPETNIIRQALRWQGKRPKGDVNLRPAPNGLLQMPLRLTAHTTEIMFITLHTETLRLDFCILLLLLFCQYKLRVKLHIFFLKIRSDVSAI